ncbi:uncharacterized protein SOCE836_028380 [Sorangium cellulosum]|uniref:non-specific serine/threonine protein kinase n=1 Tax=Sorangium cellulosum TaxID=56 RepID=A0A4P2QL07_SORCE|nr:uncharacterized protein SOCE836_028380 [Sorangium cellulosum]
MRRAVSSTASPLRAGARRAPFARTAATSVGVTTARASSRRGKFVAVAAGGTHTCGLRPNGDIDCFGSDYWQTAAHSPATFKAVAAGVHHSCGLLLNGELRCWGFYLDEEAPPLTGSYDALYMGEAALCARRSADHGIECAATRSTTKIVPRARSASLAENFPQVRVEQLPLRRVGKRSRIAARGSVAQQTEMVGPRAS